MSQHGDKSYIKLFITILAGVVAFSYIGAYLADAIQRGHEPQKKIIRVEGESARIAPVGAVATDADVSATDDSKETKVVVQTVIEQPPIDAETIYKTACFACHDTGAADAPKLEAEAWAERLPKGEEAMVASAINGIGLMPPKGGHMTLTDEEITAVVGYMLAKVQE